MSNEPTSLRNVSLSTKVPGATIMTEPITTVDTNIQPPSRALSPMETSLLPPPPENAEIELNTSGEPLPNARNVTPATLYGSFSRRQMNPRVGEK